MCCFLLAGNASAVKLTGDDAYISELQVVNMFTTDALADGPQADHVDNGGTITNSKIPATGDTTPVMLWLAFAGVSAALLLLLRRRRA